MSKEPQITYSVWFVDEEGLPVEWCAAADTLPDIMHYKMIYAQDGPVKAYMDISIEI